MTQKGADIGDTRTTMTSNEDEGDTDNSKESGAHRSSIDKIELAV